MKKIIFPPVDIVNPTDVSPIVLHLRNKRGLTDEEIIKWFEINDPQYKTHCKIALDNLNAGRGIKLQ